MKKLVSVVVLLFSGSVSHADDAWADITTISPTTVPEADHLCFSDGSATDIACSDRSVYVNATGDMSVTTLRGISLSVVGVTGAAPVSSTVSGGGSADNLGDHTATQALDMSSNNITSAGTIDASMVDVTGSVQVGSSDSVCTGSADHGKMRLNPVTGKIAICRP